LTEVRRGRLRFGPHEQVVAWLADRPVAVESVRLADPRETHDASAADVDLKNYVLVDVSQEPVDGDPNHSGDSIVRGELSFL